ncbi:iron-sulfur cluster assembly scaffold protein [Aquisalimonas lutea]|uniref:iron-sulfur cluster assembly scaffold protein n=1 Tax=Aquisalimonas lutea TaxID=1327750 RepID=UPI0025B5C5ED|nr:iron-sulfur cluster assembly scaffold protein [Aquisalimonas lutea]MDN3519317.1 iron-sulfur cluster assembly scaffold protein [Aquisalimonas lutea]
MAEMESIYREIVLDHYRHPRRFGPVDDYPRRGQAYNPLCGDDIRVGVALEHEQLAAIGFHGRGCAVCMAAASLLCETPPDTRADALRAYAGTVRAALQSTDTPLPAPLEPLGALRAYPTRHRCVTLPAEALAAALAQETGTPDD